MPPVEPGEDTPGQVPPTPPPAQDPHWRPLQAGEVGRWYWHVPSRSVSWDDSCGRLLGALPAEQPVTTWLRVVHPVDVARLEDPQLWGREEVQTFRVREGADAAPRYLLARTTAVQEEPDGSPTWIAGTMVDVSTSQEAAARATVALQTMSFCFMACDAAFRITYVNGSTEVILDRPYDTLVGKTPWEAFPFLAGGPLEVSYRQAAATGEIVSFELPGAAEGSWIASEVHPCTEGLYVYLWDSTGEHRAAQEQARLLAELERQATHDPLTGLANSTLVGRTVLAHLASAPTATVALVGIDLDRFSLINDTLGRSTGDEVLREVGSRLAEAAPTGAVVSHSNGDEFAILLRDATPAQVLAVAERALAAVRRPIRLHRQEVHLTACAGLAMADSSRDLDDLARDVDIAVHAAKRTGADSAAWCDDELRADVARRARVERDLRRALAAADQLRLHYQPSFSLVSGAPTGVEALLRWHHPLRGPVPPAEVIPVAEESGLILPLGEWVMGAAAAQAAAWRDVPQFTVWCNVAPRQLVSGDVPGALTGLLARTGLPPHRLGIEVTESVLADGSPAGTALEEVRRLGVRIAIDDFGTGYSSLSRLLAFPVDIVKIDRSFVTACETPAGRAVLEGVVNLAHGIGATTIAEGVETWEQLEVLRQTPCDAVTGFLLGKPVPAQEQALRHVRLVPPKGGPRSPAAVASRASR